MTPVLGAGTHESLLQAGDFIGTIAHRQGFKSACPEELAFRQRWFDAGQVERLARPLTKNSYVGYLLALLAEPLDAHGP